MKKKTKIDVCIFENVWDNCNGKNRVYLAWFFSIFFFFFKFAIFFTHTLNRQSDFFFFENFSQTNQKNKKERQIDRTNKRKTETDAKYCRFFLKKNQWVKH